MCYHASAISIYAFIGHVAASAPPSSVLVLNPTSLNFGNQAINTSSTAQNITATNTGVVAYSIPTISITGTNAADFSQSNNCPTSLAVSAFCTISVTFTPAATGSRTATLSVPTGSINTASLSGTGTNATGVNVAFTADNATKADGTLADTISSLAFPFAITGSASAPKATSEAERVMVFNHNGGSLTFSSITYSGTNAGDFSTATTNCSGAFANNSGCYIWIVFSPSTTGSESANLNVNFTAGSASAFPLSGTGQSGTIVSATCASIAALPNGPFGVPILAANTTYVLGTTTCTNMVFSPGVGSATSNTVLQGNCSSPNGANTVFDGTNTQNQIFPDGGSVANITLSFTLRCVTIKNYASTGNHCPTVDGILGGVSGETAQFNTNGGWVVTGSTIGPSCGIGAVLHGDSQTWRNTLVTGNPYEGIPIQIENSGGTATLQGMEFTNNSYYNSTAGGSVPCSDPVRGDCTDYKQAGAGALSETGGYHHDTATNAGGNTNAIWGDVLSGAITITGTTVMRAGGGCIRYETMVTAGTFTHNVCTGIGVINSGQGTIIGACGHAFTADFNYVTENTGYPALFAGDDARPDCGGHSYTFEASHNLVVIQTTGGGFGGTGIRYGASCISACGTVTSYSSSNNTFYLAGGASQSFIDQTMSDVAKTLATIQSGGGESGSTVTSGTPTQVPSGCTGDGTYGIGCHGSGS